MEPMLQWRLRVAPIGHEYCLRKWPYVCRYTTLLAYVEVDLPRRALVALCDGVSDCPMDGDGPAKDIETNAVYNGNKITVPPAPLIFNQYSII